MPEARAHSEHVQRSKRLLSLLKEAQELPEWVVIAAYYKAVHYVEALFACWPDASSKHCSDHDGRRRQLRQRRLSAVWKQYRPIENWSMLARYLDPRKLIVQGASGPLDLTHADAFKETWDAIVEHRLSKLKGAIRKVVPDSYKPIFA